MDSIEEGFNEQGKDTKPVFNWRDYIVVQSKIGEQVAAKLDELAGLASEDEDFMKDVPRLRQPVLSMIQYFRAVLTQEEREQLSDAARDAGEQVPLPKNIRLDLPKK
ncbi:MAG: hypothetical protein WC797_01750 [Candidatus Paceibacterota bacterium]|jgi:hypothetical protein